MVYEGNMKYVLKEYDVVAWVEQDMWVAQTVGELWTSAQGKTFLEAVESLSRTLHAEAVMREETGVKPTPKSPSDVNVRWEKAWFWSPRSTRNPDENRNKAFRFSLEEEWGSTKP